MEIPAEIKKSNSAENTILVLCEDVKTCYQLNQYLIDGPHKFLFLTALKRGLQFKSIHESFKNCGEIPTDTIPAKKSDVKPNKKLKTDANSENKNPPESTTANDEDEDSENLRSSYVLTMSQITRTETTAEENADVTFEPFSQLENMDLTQLCETTKINANPTLLIQAFKNIENGVSLYKILADIKPRFVVMYHANISAVRQIEVSLTGN